LAILTTREIDELYGLPRITDDERRFYFDLSATEREAVDSMHVGTAINFVLQLGYFKAKRQFFAYRMDAVRDDLRYVLQRHFPERDLAFVKALSKGTRLEQHQLILRLFDYRRCDTRSTETLVNKVRRNAMLSTQPITILRESLQYLENQRTHRCAGVHRLAESRKPGGDG
jgi:hypothetical protein